MWMTYGLMSLVALLHTYFMVLESFLWKNDATRAKFGMTVEYAETTATLAMNQGVYNLFLAAGLVFALVFRADPMFTAIATFFLGCVVVAGIVGGMTVGPKIFYIQAAPAALA